MNILILGGTGFVSGYAARAALARGDRVWTLTRGQRPLNAGAQALIADRHDEAAMKKALAGLHFDLALDCICRTAGDARIDLAVLPEVADHAVIVSTDSVYDPARKKVPQDEDGCYLRDDGYGADKRRMEEVFLQSGTAMKWTIFRPGHIFGEGSLAGCYPEETRNAAIPARILAGEPMRLVGGGEYLLQAVYVGDLVRAMLACAGNPGTYGRIFCIGGPDVVTCRRYYEILGEILGRAPRFETVPEEGYLAAHPEYSGHLCHRVYDLSRLKAAGLPVPETSLREGLARQVEALRRQA